MSFYPEPPGDEYSEAKLIILKMLWDGEWILGDDILAEVKQAYYDRRIRELRDENGWEIETGLLKTRQGVSRPAYRLNSHARGKGIRRPHIANAERQFVLTRDHVKCQISGDYP